MTGAVYVHRSGLHPPGHAGQAAQDCPGPAGQGTDRGVCRQDGGSPGEFSHQIDSRQIGAFCRIFYTLQKSIKNIFSSTLKRRTDCEKI